MNGGGTYLSTITAEINCSECSRYNSFYYIKLNNGFVKLYGLINATATTANTAMLVSISLPITSSLTVGYQAVGIGQDRSNLNCGYINAETNVINFTVKPPSTLSSTYNIEATYPII